MTSPQPGPGYRPGRFVYTDDVGNCWQVSIALRFGNNPALGFEPYDSLGDNPGVRRFPATGLKMRHINAVNRETGLRRELPVGKLTAPVWSAPPPPVTLDLLEPQLGKTLTFVVTSRVGERQRGMA